MVATMEQKRGFVWNAWHFTLLDVKVPSSRYTIRLVDLAEEVMRREREQHVFDEPPIEKFEEF